ncbi:MAG: site-specific integrase [Candidatus Bathyarchaeia archaeon]
MLRSGEKVQRWLCRECGHRSTDAKQLQSNPEKRLINRSGSFLTCQVGVIEGTKNLAIVEQTNGLAGATADDAGFKGKIIEYEFWLLKNGYAKSTIFDRVKLMKRLIKLGANLFDPETIKEILTKQTWCAGRKEYVVETYSNFLLMAGGKWDPPRYSRIEKIPFIPTELEIDQLIAGCGEKTTTLLQSLKETGMRIGEAWNLKWLDIDFVNSTLSITPEKGSHARMFKVSSKLMAMLAMQPKKSVKVFGTYELRGYRSSFIRQRKRTAHKLGNPRINQITFHTFRHWKATMEYHKTKDILHVMRLLGHKNIKNTLIYTQLVTFEDDDYVCKAATNIKEATQLIEAGYEYITEMDNIKLFRKRK